MMHRTNRSRSRSQVLILDRSTRRLRRERMVGAAVLFASSLPVLMAILTVAF